MNEPSDVRARKALDAFLERQYPKVKQYFRRRFPEPVCYDLAQDALATFVEKANGDLEDPERYLWGVVRFRGLQHIDGQRGRDRHQHLLRESFASTRSIASTLDRRERAGRLIAELEDEELHAFELAEVYELTWPAIAEAMGLSESTAKRRAREARAKLDEALGRLDAEAAVVEIRRGEVGPSSSV